MKDTPETFHFLGVVLL